MKTRLHYLLTILGIFLTAMTLAQCPTGDVTLNFQAQVDAFGQMYGHCPVIEGNLTIFGDDITDLEPLGYITSVKGSVYIHDNPQLTSLSGLDKIGSVGSWMTIGYNYALQSLDGLGALRSVGGNFNIYSNTALTTMSHLSKLGSVSGTLYIENHPNLTSLEGLGQLTSVGGGLTIHLQETLQNVEALENLTSVSGKVSLFANPALTSLLGLQNIDPATITELNITGNENLSVCDLTNICSYLEGDGPRTISGNATGCESVTEVEGKCNPPACPTGDIALTTQAEVNAFGQTYGHCTVIEGNLSISGAGITSLSPLQHITSIKGGLKIIDADNLTTLAGLGNITSVGGGLEIEENDGLTNLSGLDQLTSVRGYMDIEENDGIINLSGLDQLTSVGGVVYIQENNNLTNLSGLDQLTSVGDLYIWFNPNLITLSALGTLTSNQGSLHIVGNDALTNLSGLEGITSIKGTLYFGGNDMLTDLSALENITSIGTSLLSIQNNEKLTTLQGLHNIAPESINYLRITDNPNLSICDMSNICAVLESDARIVIEKNDMGCNSAMEVQTACLPEVKSITSPVAITAACGSSAQDLGLPSTVQVTYDDLSTGQLAVNWDLTNYTGQKGTDTLTGNLDLMDLATNPDNLTPELVVIVEAPEKPLLQCTNSYIISCDPVVHFDLPIATDQCGAVRVEQTDGTGLSSGSVFPVGVTTLTYRAANAAGSSYCTIEVEILPDLKIQHVSGVTEGDTLHLAACLPPRISKDDLDLGAYLGHSRVTTRVFSQDAPSDSADGIWKILRYEYEVNSYCGERKIFQNYVALYDLSPPKFRYFPSDVTIASTDELPPVPEEVYALDICRFVVWDTVTTTAIPDPETGDTLAFVRRWIAEDEVGNRSFRDQMIYLALASGEKFGSLTAHVAKESDLINAHFPGSAGTDGIPVTLYRIDSNAMTTSPVDSLESGNWQGLHGNMIFTPLQTGLYRLRIEVPQGYIPIHTDSLFTEDGWSDSMVVRGNDRLDLGTILLIPAPDTVMTDTLFPEVQVNGTTDPPSKIDRKTFTLYPNPTSGRITITTSQPGPFDFRIYNHLGQLIKRGTAANGSDIDLSDHVTGMYFIQLKSGDHDLGGKRILLMAR